MVMALIYTKCGEFDQALDQLQVLLSEQTDVSVNSIRMNSNFAPLRELPRYQQMMRDYQSTAGLP